MSLTRRRHLIVGFTLGLGSAASTSAQDLPPVFLPPPAESAGPPLSPAASTSPVVHPAPPIIAVPPEGVRPIWAPAPIDPIALQRKDHPGIGRLKSRSWHWRRLQGKLWGYPEEYEPRPLGASLYEHGRTMTANGAAARLVLYQFDFVDGTSELNARGLDQLGKFTAQLAVSPFPLIVERTTADPSLAESRRYAVLARLARGPCPLPSDRVLVGEPIPHGMSGTDAYVIGLNALQRTQQYGPPIPLQSNGVNSPSGVTTNSAAGAGITP